MNRAYYSDTLKMFLTANCHEILGQLSKYNEFNLERTQRNAWLEQIEILKNQLALLDEGYIIFEYTIPRMGKRIDNILIYKGCIFAIEFKVGEKEYRKQAIDQVTDYCLDLKNFHKESHDKLIFPILVSTDAQKIDSEEISNNIVQLCNKLNLSKTIRKTYEKFQNLPNICYKEWFESKYSPTPTIIEAAQALYKGHHVEEISRNEAGATNLSITSKEISSIIEKSKIYKQKSIVFLTGVPGSGKTLAGLNIANSRHDFEHEEHAIFLSGNGPLVKVLQEALARDNSTNKITKKKDALQKAKAFIQNIHHFRDDNIISNQQPVEKIVIFDEAQRAWNKDETISFMRTKKGKFDFNMSEPECLIEIMDRHQDWAVIVCLIGGGQEINKGEGGLPEWFNALKLKFSNWYVYLSDKIYEEEYLKGETISNLTEGLVVTISEHLHLSTSIRSFRSEYLAQFIKTLLDVNVEKAYETAKVLLKLYPICVTRDLRKAKSWIYEKARGSERYGLIASSNGCRLKPYGIMVKNKISPEYWFLNSKNDIRSSFYMEDIATEFDIQGLELDWSCLAWDADFRFMNGEFKYYKFSGTEWQKRQMKESQEYLKNAYRVLLTRARQGMVIFIPEGDAQDYTRLPNFYDELYEYLLSLGVSGL